MNKSYIIKGIKQVAIATLILSTIAISVLLLPAVTFVQDSGEFRTDLIAGRHTDVGDIVVWNNETHLFVEFIMNESWILKEIHLEVATSLEDIPQTRKGNPIPGRFEYKAEFDVGDMVSDYTFIIPLDEILEEFSSSTELYIAAHAVVVELTKVATIVSDTDTLVISGNGDDGTTYPHNAVYAWEPYSDDTPSFWDKNVDYNFSKNGADWIWESYRVMHPIKGDIVTFRKDFEIGTSEKCCHRHHHSINPIVESLCRCHCHHEYPLVGVLHITADNGYEVYLNDELVGSAQLGEGYYTSDLTEQYVNTNGWQSIEHYKVAPLLKYGMNNLTIIAVNEYFGPKDGQNNGTIFSNPAGLIFELEISLAKHKETAWGQGERFNCRNWAMYFTYTIETE